MPDLLVDDKCMQALQPMLMGVASHLKARLVEGKYFAIRYHHDCDGICAGVCVFKALNSLPGEAEGNVAITSIPSPSAVITINDAYNDLNKLNDSKDTVMLILDHGANSESIAGLEILKSAGVELILIDHHPFDRKAQRLAKFFISPFIAGGNSSHTAGLLCYELAKAINPGSVEKQLAYFSLQSDKSEFRLQNKEYKQPLAIDYLASIEECGLNFYEVIIEDEAAMDDAFSQATEKIEAAMKKSEHYTEVRDFGKYAVVVAKVGKFLAKGEFPNRGKIMNEIIARKERELNKPLVCLGILDDGISFRANAKVLKMGFDANAIIQELKRIFGNEVYEGGGHSAAASIRGSRDAIGAIEKETIGQIKLLLSDK
ncbi:MAG: DHH family phosphoesterase [Candidatus Micrarchaeota archaeon]